MKKNANAKQAVKDVRPESGKVNEPAKKKRAARKPVAEMLAAPQASEAGGGS